MKTFVHILLWLLGLAFVGLRFTPDSPLAWLLAFFGTGLASALVTAAAYSGVPYHHYIHQSSRHPTRRR